MRKGNGTSGFTFIEILVVATMIAILTTIGAVSYTSTNRRSRDVKRKADLEQIRAALEICRAEHGSYPTDITGGVVCSGDTYLSPLPADPKDGQEGFGYSYIYQSAVRYQLCANLENESECTTGETNPCCYSNP